MRLDLGGHIKDFLLVYENIQFAAGGAMKAEKDPKGEFWPLIPFNCCLSSNPIVIFNLSETSDLSFIAATSLSSKTLISVQLKTNFHQIGQQSETFFPVFESSG